MAIDWNNYFDMPLWAGTLGICLMFGIDEDVYKSNQENFFYDDEYQKIRLHIKKLKADAIAGVIPYQSNGDEFYYNPKKLTEWAIFKGLPVPSEPKKKVDNLKQISEIVQIEVEKLEPQSASSVSDKHLNHFSIAELWATKNAECNHEVYEGNIAKIHQAVFDGDLKAEVSIKNPSNQGGWEIIPNNPTILSQVSKDGQIKYKNRNTYVQYMIHRDDFRAWLIKSNQWPLADGCLLAEWFDSEQQTEAVGDDGAGSPGNQEIITTRPGGYFERDKAAIKILKDNPDLRSMRPKAIKAELLEKNRGLFASGYTNWWRGQKIFPKGKPGTNKNRKECR